MPTIQLLLPYPCPKNSSWNAITDEIEFNALHTSGYFTNIRWTKILYVIAQSFQAYFCAEPIQLRHFRRDNQGEIFSSVHDVRCN